MRQTIPGLGLAKIGRNPGISRDPNVALIHRVSNYSDLLPEMPRFCYPLIEIRLKLRTGCQDQRAGKSAVKCLSQGHKSMVEVGFELRPCRSQSRRSKHSTTMLTKQYLFVFYLVIFSSSIVCFSSVFIYCWLIRIFFTLQFVKQPAAIIVATS